MTDPRHPAAYRAPRVLADRFELGAAIGRGGSAVVHRASDRQTGATVAVKLVDPDAQGRERFEREVRTLAQLAAPGVVRYIAHGRDGDDLFLVEEWLAGGSLRGQLAGAGVTAAEAVRVAHATAAALSAVHAAGVVHRDLKPEHIWLGEADPDGEAARDGRDRLGRVTLIDFGIARGPRDPRVTATGSSLGTPGYMAPEQARGDRVIDARADVFALGAVLFEALTGAPAFLGHSEGSTRAKVLLAAPPALAPRCPEAPPPLIALVDAMLAKHPDDRPGEGAAVAAALAQIAVAPGPRRRPSSDLLAQTLAQRPRTPSAAVFVIAAGHAPADVHQLSTLAGTRAMLVDGALWLAVVPAAAGAARARDTAQAWHDLLGTPAAVAAGELDAAVDWVADAIARAALLAEFAAFAAPPPAIQLDATTTTLLAAAR